MAGDDRDIWFPAKRYGWGWGFPVAWQGWLVLAIYILLLFFGTNEYLRTQNLMFFAYLAVITFGLIVVCYKKGETPRWRWGKDDEGG